MRNSLTILLLFVYSISFAGNTDTSGLSKAVMELNEALLKKDSVKLKSLLHEKVQYGHSNGWIESRKEIIDDLFSGNLVYNKLSQGGLAVIEEKGIVCVRSKMDIDVALDGMPVQMSLHVLQVWIKGKNGWVLFNRQSTKIN